MRIEGVLFWVFPHRGECEFREKNIMGKSCTREKNILGKSCTTFVIVKIVRNLSRGRSPCQRVNHVKSGVIYFSAFIYSCIRYYSYVEPGPLSLSQTHSHSHSRPRPSLRVLYGNTFFEKNKNKITAASKIFPKVDLNADNGNTGN